MLHTEIVKVLFEEAMNDFEKYLKMYDNKKMSRDEFLLKIRCMIFEIFLYNNFQN